MEKWIDLYTLFLVASAMYTSMTQISLSPYHNIDMTVTCIYNCIIKTKNINHCLTFTLSLSSLSLLPLPIYLLPVHLHTQLVASASSRSLPYLKTFIPLKSFLPSPQDLHPLHHVTLPRYQRSLGRVQALPSSSSFLFPFSRRPVSYLYLYPTIPYKTTS